LRSPKKVVGHRLVTKSDDHSMTRCWGPILGRGHHMVTIWSPAAKSVFFAAIDAVIYRAKLLKIKKKSW
ncbi:hypothetical protein, partial [Congregibacter sp.]|uniref:hypothetical protein n=1 Tax=Congregibacter sp. TaxID=2744308 RepID=UPI003F6C67D1